MVYLYMVYGISIYEIWNIKKKPYFLILDQGTRLDMTKAKASLLSIKRGGAQTSQDKKYGDIIWKSAT